MRAYTRLDGNIEGRALLQKYFPQEPVCDVQKFGLYNVLRCVLTKDHKGGHSFISVLKPSEPT